MMIFRILCGEWIEPLWDCMKAEEKEVNTYINIFIYYQLDLSTLESVHEKNTNYIKKVGEKTVIVLLSY